MRKLLVTLAAAASLALAAIAIPTAAPVQAQGDQPIMCDSTLATLVYVAIHDYGYQPSMDVTKFEQGQFAPLYAAMMQSMMSSTPEAMMEATPAMMEATPEMMMGGTVLKAGVVTDEPEACTQLRAEVEGYLFAKFSAGMMMK
jgi:ABC-type proline/glycine betaine transport system substrate-binding protein